jgi:hypothetical protein
MMHRISKFLALLLGLACGAGAFAQPSDLPETYIGRKYWYEPKHEEYAPIQFHRVPDFDKGKFTLLTKSKFEVLAYSRGWFRLRFESGAYGENFIVAYVPALILRSRLYAPTITEPLQQAFYAAAIFEEDPDLLKLRLNQASKSTGKTTAEQPPWKIRRHAIAPSASPAPPLSPPPE